MNLKEAGNLLALSGLFISCSFLMTREAAFSQDKRISVKCSGESSTLNYLPAKRGTGLAVDTNPERIKQAERILAENREFLKESNLFIAQAEESVSEAKKLQGQAHQYQKNLQLHAPLLSGKALSDARKQYKLDLADFAKHVKLYNMHTQQVRQNYGHCKASLAAFEKMKKELELHCDQFHMKNIEPPHICLQIDSSVVEALGAQNKVKAQAERVAQAEMDLAKTEARLQKSIAERGIIDGEVMAKSKLALKEQALAEEFGRLKEEHRQLDVERKAISRSTAAVSVPSVKGRIKKN
ncbi:MAG: hypothetical protein K2X27_20055 [Candidatus Obscuribacterales bacterium]|nr:hypothetical protein [Candidatus Obscuribacterales bacterium]